MSFTGAVTSFDGSSELTYGAAYYGTDLLPSPKMQIVDLRYYINYVLLDADITSIYMNTSCHSSCTNCNGPGNYSCNDFIQLIDPNVGWTGDGSSGQYGLSYVKWSTSDSFMMGKTFSGNASAFSGWVNCSYIHNNWVNLFRAAEANDNGCGSKGRTPAIFHHPSTGYHYTHCKGGSQNVINTVQGYQ